MMNYFWTGLLIVSFVVLGCKDEEQSEPPIEYHLTIGDSSITIPDAAVRFAGFRADANKFVWDAYMLREYQVARDTSLSHQGAAYTGSLGEWKALNWSTRQTFLIAPYARDAKNSDLARYYYDIGTFRAQFGYGWRDTFDPDASWHDPAVDIWLHPADSTVVPDNPSTVEFDGTTHLMAQYRAMWIIQ